MLFRRIAWASACFILLFVSARGRCGPRAVETSTEFPTFLIHGGQVALPGIYREDVTGGGAGLRPPNQESTGAGSRGSGDELEDIKSDSSQDERIARLTQFISLKRNSRRADEARELLMREYALKGEQDLKEGDPARAASDFKSVLSSAPAELTDRLFDQYIFPLPVAMNTFGYRTESAELMRSFEARFAGDPSRLIQIGFFYVQIEAPLEAVRVLERAVHLAPADHRAHNSLGTAYLINLRLDDAATEFSKALELDPNDEYANLNTGNILRARGEYDKAVGYYQSQIKLKPSDSESHGGLAISLLALGRDEEASPEIKAAEEMGKDNYRFYTQIAYFYVTRKKYDLARQMVLKAVAIEPRYTWAHIVKAEVDLAEDKFGDALSTMIMAQQLGSFPTLSLELAKAFMSVDGYDQAAEVLSKVVGVTSEGEFETTLGGVLKVRSPRLDLLLQRERQAALFLDTETTTQKQYKMAECLLRIDHYEREAASAKASGKRTPARRAVAATRRKGRPEAARRREPDERETASKVETEPSARPRRASGPVAPPQLSAGADAGLPGITELLDAITQFCSLDDGRQAFRMLWAARTLSERRLALDAAVELANTTIQVADIVTEPDDSMRDSPLLDRDGRRAVFLGRAEDCVGWTLLKEGNTRAALDHLTKSVSRYPDSQEKKTAVWHLAVATEQAGDEAHALDLYIEAYDSSSPTASIRRAAIEALYKKLKGTTDGLNERLGQN